MLSPNPSISHQKLTIAMNSIMYLYDWLLSQCCEILGSDEDSPCKSITRRSELEEALDSA